MITFLSLCLCYYITWLSCFGWTSEVKSITMIKSETKMLCQSQESKHHLIFILSSWHCVIPVRAFKGSVLHFQAVMLMTLSVIVKIAWRALWGRTWSQRCRCRGGWETGDVGSWDVTLGCAANSAGTFSYTVQWMQHPAHKQLPADCLSVPHFKNPPLWVWNDFFPGRHIVW